MAYKNPIEGFLSGAFRAIIGPILAPFLLLAMGLAEVLAPYIVKHGWFKEFVGTDLRYAANNLTIPIFTLIILSPLLYYIGYKICQLLHWIFNQLMKIEWKKQTVVRKTTPSFEPKHQDEYYYPKFKGNRLIL